jgi:ABC-2 type transport system ATP-binding protein
MTGVPVLVEGVHVRFGDVQALAGVDLDVAPGATVGVLGHNGAGKTTLIRTMTTRIRPTRGRVLVDGFDVAERPDLVRRRIGVTGQYAGLDEYLTGREHLELLARLTGAAGAARGRSQELIDRMGLAEVAERRIGTLSGGWRRRVDLAASLVANPSVLFLDEPTTGLDPIARAGLWDVVGDLNRAGTTVVLTTQYLEEADRLADQIVVLDRGRIVAQGAPDQLKRLVGGKSVTATVPSHHLDRLVRRPEHVQVIGEHARISYPADDAGHAAALVAELATDLVALAEIGVSSPTLDDVLTHLTIHSHDPIGALR